MKQVPHSTGSNERMGRRPSASIGAVGGFHNEADVGAFPEAPPLVTGGKSAP